MTRNATLRFHASLASLFVIAVPLGCASTTMSAAEHRQRAAEEQTQADKHDARYDEDARAAHVDTPLGAVSFAPNDYNPTHFEREAADAHERSAQAHLDAAHALESSEETACQGIAPAAREACPIFAAVAVDDVPRGVRLRFVDETTAAKAAQLAACQQAFARTRDFDDLPTCILYARALFVTRQERDVTLVATDPAGVARIRSNVRAHLAPAHAP